MKCQCTALGIWYVGHFFQCLWSKFALWFMMHVLFHLGALVFQVHLPKDGQCYNHQQWSSKWWTLTGLILNTLSPGLLHKQDQGTRRYHMKDQSRKDKESICPCTAMFQSTLESACKIGFDSREPRDPSDCFNMIHEFGCGNPEWHWMRMNSDPHRYKHKQYSKSNCSEVTTNVLTSAWHQLSLLFAWSSVLCLYGASYQNQNT